MHNSVFGSFMIGLFQTGFVTDCVIESAFESKGCLFFSTERETLQNVPSN